MIGKELLLGLLVESEVEEDGGIVLKMDECEALDFMVINLCLREFFSGDHVNKYVESKANRENGAILRKSFIEFLFKLMSS